MYFIYSVLTAAAMVVLAPYFFVQGLRQRKYIYNLKERFGYLPPEVAEKAEASRGAIWIHGVSVGELLAGMPLVKGLKERFPERPLFVSTTTATGQQLARERLGLADGIFYFPFDWQGPVRRVMRAMRPELIVILETEIWPNFLREARRRNIPVVFANARLSERSFVRLQRFRGALDGFVRSVLADAGQFLAQSEMDAERFRQLGACGARVQVIGNLKYDGQPPAENALSRWLGREIAAQERWPVLVAGSVVAEEEEAVLAAYDIVQRQWRRALLVLAPRKPERFEVAARILGERGWRVARRSQMDLQQGLAEDGDVFLVDSIGELAALYGLADAVFVGGSLVQSGGHNILEPAWFGRAPVFGPSMEHFREMAASFLRAGAGIQVTTGENLGKAWAQLIRDDRMRERMGEAARRLVEQNRGATARTLEFLADLLRERAGKS